MTPQQKACRLAWAESRFADSGLSDKELSDRLYAPPENFASGFDKGAEWALQNQWKAPEAELPQLLQFVVAFCDCECPLRAAYYDGENFYTADGEDRRIHPLRWMPIPLPTP